MMSLDSNFNKLKLNIGQLQSRSKVNGPGERFVIWLQGCSLRCKGCINTEFLPQRPNQVISVSQLYNLIMNIPQIEGVTYSGGEPFEQAEGLYYLSTLLKGQGLTLMSYSGFTYDELIKKNDKYILGLLSTLDILVDGRYEESKASPLLWRGSKNQKIYFFSQRYKHYKEIVDGKDMQIEMAVDNKSVSFTGNFDKDILQKITDRLKKDYGIVLK